MPKNKNKNYFTYIDNEGNEIECRILYTFDLEETNWWMKETLKLKRPKK